MKLGFSPKIFENPQISSFTKIRPVGADLCRADGRTDGWTDGRMTEGRTDRRTDG